jgi:hypothetical protein
MGSKEPKPWSPRWVTLEESFTESFRMEEGGGRRSQRCLARERERERDNFNREEHNDREKKGVMAVEAVFKEERQTRWCPTVIQEHQRR